MRAVVIYLHDKFRYTRIHKVINVYGGGLSRKLVLGNIYRPRDINENFKYFIDEFKHVI